MRRDDLLDNFLQKNTGEVHACGHHRMKYLVWYIALKTLLLELFNFLVAHLLHGRVVLDHLIVCTGILYRLPKLQSMV